MIRKRIHFGIAGVGGLILALGCSDPAGPEACGDGDAIPLEGGSCLVFQDGGLLDVHRAEIEQTVRQTITAVRALMPLDEVSIRILAGTATVIPEIGIGGRAFGTEDVQIVLNPESPNLEASLPTELFSLIAHELHHTMRQRTVGYGADLLGAMISEGLADHFSIEVAGVDPPLWSTALSETELEVWKVRAQEEWFNRNYNHDAWFFGAGGEIPRWAGYTIGFQLVEEFLAAHPDQRASTLFDEAAQAFVTGE